MRWPFRPAPDPDQSKPQPDAARRDLAVTRAETPRIAAFAAELRRLRESNHFAESIAAAIKGGH